MASLASPTPLPHGYRELSHRPSRSMLSRSQLSQPHPKRGSPLYGGHASDHDRHNSFDSSDDEAPVPQLSAAAEELLGVKTGEIPAAESLLRNTNRIQYNNGSPIARDTFHAPRILGRTQRTTSPPVSNTGSPRIVKINSVKASAGSLRRAVSVAGISDGSPLAMRGHSDLKTPGSRPRSMIGRESISPHELGSHSGKVSSSASGVVATASSLRNKSEEPGIQGSIRVKRLGKMSGSFLSGPARRGMIRRQSEEDHVPYSADQDLLGDDNADWIPNTAHDQSKRSRPTSPREYDARHRQKVHFAREPTPQHESPIPIASREALESIGKRQGNDDQLPPGKASLMYSIKNLDSPVFRPMPPPHISPHLDQENIPPPTFRRDKNSHDIISLLDKPRLADIVSNAYPSSSPSRKVLAAKTNNTPLRPAPPPPPKMSILETATAPAPSSAANSKRKPRNMISVNGKHFTRMECVGRGGSGRVYRVMAENFKLYAVKSVSLEGLDELTIRGFRGEIELLKKLSDCDRVVRLYDYEINEEKQVLRVLMDIGELDLKKILDPKMNTETGKFDITFTRHYWKEMLECVAAVHAQDIVHSDLKPANFVMIQGQLKLIDFGIANAIQDDTVNVHREQQVGTPNYMSPETLIDTNVHNGKRMSGAGKLMKVGKPSDVWSLGCILYQIVYGNLPFAHITNHVRKAMAIIDPTHAIAYPTVGVGAVPVPTGLIRTLRKCLDRDPSRRPTVEQLLSMGDMFLHPDAPGTVPVSVELIGRLQHNIVQHIIAHGVPSEEELKIWPKKFFESIRAAVEEGRA